MEVYIEYAFLENFALDFVLLYLSLRLAKQKIFLAPLLISSAVGGVLAVVFPLLSLREGAKYLLKWATGFLLCFLAFGRIKSKKEWGRYALNTFFFFVSTFFFGGAITAFGFANKGVWLEFIILSCAILLFVKLLYQKRKEANLVYDCTVQMFGVKKSAQGFYDTGNLARFENVPVCFLSSDFMGLFLVEKHDFTPIFEQKRITISTLSGEKSFPVFSGEIEVKQGTNTIKKEVYFALSGHMVKGAYKIILHSEILD